MFNDIFVSYHKHQINEVQRFCCRFRKSGMKIWCDQICNKPFINIFDHSLTALTHSYLFVCFFSRKYKNSLKCKTELMVAQEQNLQIVLFILDDIDNQDPIFDYPNIVVFNVKNDLEFSIETIDPKYICFFNKLTDLTNQTKLNNPSLLSDNSN